MIASLPMYTNDLTRGACDRFWSAWSQRLCENGLDAPQTLAAGDDNASDWTSPNLMISQTCGYPYVSGLRGRVRLVATPHYDVEGCDGPNYVSWLVVRADSKAAKVEDLRGSRAAINGVGSQSGYNSFRSLVAPHAAGEEFFSDVITSGGHARSMRMVADGEADCATIDAVSWQLTIDENPELANRLCRMGATPSLPGLPFITAASRSDAELKILRETLSGTLVDPALHKDLEVMHISEASVVPDAAYDACLDMERAAIAAGYPTLA